MFYFGKSLSVLSGLLALLCFENQSILAQVTPDLSLGLESAIVIPFSDFFQLIQGGAIRGENLFQSYQNFNISEGQTIILTNPDGVNNILIRVTGNHPSNLLGTLGLIKESTINNLLINLPSLSEINLSSLITTQDIGTANIFFLNPNGILFGENASLNVGGSFIATTANQIKFADGTFFSTNLTQSSPLLTVSTPIGLQFTQSNTQPIIVQGRERELNHFLQNSNGMENAVPNLLEELLINRSFTITQDGQLQQLGLRVNPDKTLALVGGNVNLQGGIVTAQGGRIEIGSVINGGNVSLTPISQGWQLSYEEIDQTHQGNINLDQLALINPDILGQGNGEVHLQGRQVNLSNESAIISFTLGDNKGGNINLNATDINISNESILATGTINSLSLLTLEEITLFTLAPLSFLQSSLADPKILYVLGTISQTTGNPLATNGSSGNLLINTQNLTVNDFSIIGSLTSSNGQLGDIILKATDTITLDNSLLSEIYLGQGEGGDILIETQNLYVLNNTDISNDPSLGNGGDININASELITIEGNNSSISASVIGTGNGGDITLSTQQLKVSQGGVIAAELGLNSTGEGGNLTINASKIINIQDIGSGISTTSLGQGNAGSITLNTDIFNLNNGAKIAPLTLAQGRGGNLIINALESINLAGLNTRIGTDSIGTNQGGNITLNTENLTLKNGAAISSVVTHLGNAGNITINATESVFIQGNNTGISNETQGMGNAGNLTINTQYLTMSEGGSLFSTTSGKGQGGTIDLQTEHINLQDNARLAVSSTNTGNAGNIILKTTHLEITSSSIITAATEKNGQGGSIQINTNSLILDTKSKISVIAGGEGNAGNINLMAVSLDLKNEAIVSAETQGTGQGGFITITTNRLNLDNQGQITTLSLDQGNAGNINLNITDLFQAQDGLISANANQASGGEINITAQDIRLAGNSDIQTNVESGAGGGGNITLTAHSIINFNDSDILAFAQDGRGGDILLNTPVFFGDGYQPTSSIANPDSLNGNRRVDLNASGAVSGVILIPDLTFIQNSLVQLPDSLINPEQLISNRCILPERSQRGQFSITGSGGLPPRPGEPNTAPYPTGTVQEIPPPDHKPTWQKGDPIIEPQGVYRSPNGRLFLSRECL